MRMGTMAKTMRLRPLWFALALIVAGCPVAAAESDDADYPDRAPPTNAAFPPLISCAYRVGVQTEPKFAEAGPTWTHQLRSAFEAACAKEMGAFDKATAGDLALSKPRAWAAFKVNVDLFIWTTILHGVEQNALARRAHIRDGVTFGYWAARRASRVRDASPLTALLTYSEYSYKKVVTNAVASVGVIDGTSFLHEARAPVSSVASFFWFPAGPGQTAFVGWGPSDLAFADIESRQKPKFTVDCEAADRCRIRGSSPSPVDHNGVFRVDVPHDGSQVTLCVAQGDPDDGDDLLQAGLTVDGVAVPLSRKGCATGLERSWLTKLAGARVIAGHAQKDADGWHRYGETDGAGFSVAVALAEKLRTGELESLRGPLVDRARGRAPQTVFDLMRTTSAWRAAVSCAAHAREPRRECAPVLRRVPTKNFEGAIMTGTLDPHEFKEGSGLGSYDVPGGRQLDLPIMSSLPFNEKALDPYWPALTAEAKQARDWRVMADPWTAQFGEGETDTTLDGKPARAGVTGETFYAYAVDGDQARATVLRASNVRRDAASISITCRRQDAPACTIVVPFENYQHALVFATDGDAWSSTMCVNDAAAEGARILVSVDGFYGAALDARGCANRWDTGAFVHDASSAIALIEGSGVAARERAFAIGFKLGDAFDLARHMVRELGR
jgi:hypothetical protein